MEVFMEEIIKIVPFSHNNKTYEIKIFKTVSGYSVKSYFNGNRANGYSYSADTTDFIGLALKDDVYTRLVEIAISDIESDMWNKFTHGGQK
jgi:hypothetical protein